MLAYSRCSTFLPLFSNSLWFVLVVWMAANKNANVDVLVKLAAFTVLLLEFFLLCYLSVPFFASFRSPRFN
jgi:hypothetical protein